ncbi:hypothetical protein RIF29_14177 [Crotalaria pallida]|uniref:Uncharacterized protein n=1 Tax=Crotalaria pallida TaxID=3830 RepID=A0AAN9II05_CROPI
MVEEASEETLLEEAKTPLLVIFHGMIQAGLIEPKEKVEILDVKEGSCIFHGSKDHSIETCTKVKMLIQKLMDSGFLKISKQVKIGDVNMVEGSTSKPKVVPVLQLFKGEPCFQRFEPSSTPIPTPFPYLNSKAVPWKYAEVNAVVEDHLEESGEKNCWIRPRPPGFELNNWEVIEFPKIVLSPVSIFPISM